MKNMQVVRSIMKTDLEEGCYACGYNRLTHGVNPQHQVCCNCEAEYVGNEGSMIVDVFLPDKMVSDSYYQLVKRFQDYFGITEDATTRSVPSLPTEEVFMFKMNHIQEELTELHLAFDDQNLVEMSDALVDVVYVILGLACNMNLPFDRLFKLVHEANMQKRRVQVASDSKRNCRFDVIKPEGWSPADLEFALKNAGAEL